MNSVLSGGRDIYLSKVKFRAAAICPQKAVGFSAFDADDSCVVSIDVRLRSSISSYFPFESGSFSLDSISQSGVPFLWTGRLSSTKWTEIELDVSQIYWFLSNRNYLFTFLAETISLSPIYGLQFSFGAWTDEACEYCPINSNGSPCSATAVLIQTTGPLVCPAQRGNVTVDHVDWHRVRPDEVESSRSIHVFLDDCGTSYQCSNDRRRLDGNGVGISLSVDDSSVVTQIEYRTN
jgi:hypothetical protein